MRTTNYWIDRPMSFFCLQAPFIVPFDCQIQLHSDTCHYTHTVRKTELS